MTLQEFRQLVGGVEYYAIYKFIGEDHAEEIGEFSSWHDADELNSFDNWEVKYFEPQEDLGIYIELSEEEEEE